MERKGYRMFGRVVCEAVGHKVARDHVWYDGIDFRTSCRRCSEQMIRGSQGWREFDDGRDAGYDRAPHPYRAA